MPFILKAAITYVVITFVLRLAGKRTFGQLTSFDLVLLLIISEATQQSLIGDDRSLTRAVLTILTLVTIDIGVSLLKQRVPKLDRGLDSLPVILVENGEVFEDRLQKSRVDVADILSAARSTQGVRRLEDIAYAVLEREGTVSIIPRA